MLVAVTFRTAAEAFGGTPPWLPTANSIWVSAAIFLLVVPRPSRLSRMRTGLLTGWYPEPSGKYPATSAMMSVADCE